MREKHPSEQGFSILAERDAGAASATTWFKANPDHPGLAEIAKLGLAPFDMQSPD